MPIFFLAHFTWQLLALMQVWQQMAPRVYRNLDEIFAGEYEGMTYDEIKATFPDEAKMRAMDKIGYRYPRGESYLDLLSRLDPLVSMVDCASITNPHHSTSLDFESLFASWHRCSHGSVLHDPIIIFSGSRT